MKKKYGLSVLFALFMGSISAQTDSLLNERLTNPIINCELVAVNAQGILTGLFPEQLVEIEEVLDFWESYCGPVEPINRVRLLLSVYHNSFNDSASNNYIFKNSYYFRTRIKARDEDEYFRIYESEKGYFNYVPLRSEFDGWTRSIAVELLGKQTKGSSQYLICMLLSEQVDEYYTLLKSEEYRNNPIRTSMVENYYKNQNPGMDYTFLAGIWLPTGKMTRNFSASPLLGLKMGFQTSKKYRFDLGMQIAVLVNDKNYFTNIADTLTSTNSDIFFKIGMTACRLLEFEKGWFSELSGGIAYGMLDTRIKKPLKDNNTEDTYYSIGALDLSMGAGIRKHLGLKTSLGLSVDYHYSPFEMDRKLSSDIGNQYATITVSVRF